MKRLLPLLVVLCAGMAVGGSAASINGRVSFVTKRGQRPNINETLIWLEPATATKGTKKAAPDFQMVTRSKTLLPHVLAVPAGSTVQFPNDDPISHNLFSLSQRNSFDLGLYRKGPGKSQTFENPGVVNVYCNVHPNMSAVIHVMPTPYYAFADQGGNFALNDVAPGRYRLVAWNEQGGMASSDVEVTAAGQIAGKVALTIDGRNFRGAQQHTNKFGKTYQTPSSKEY
jgi:plastocyanin